jgi:hypothetical protein
MEVSCRFHDPATLAPKKAPPLPTEHENGWNPELGRDFSRTEKNSLRCRDSISRKRKEGKIGLSARNNQVPVVERDETTKEKLRIVNKEGSP